MKTKIRKMFRLLQLLFVGVVAMGAAGCVTLKTHEEATSGRTASLRIVSTNPKAYYTTAVMADPIACKPSTMFGHVTGGSAARDKHEVEMLDQVPPGQGILQRKIPAGAPISFAPHIYPMLNFVEVMTSMGVSQGEILRKQVPACKTPAFVPVEGAQYELTYKIAPGMCEPSLKRLVGKGDGSVLREEVEVAGGTFVKPVLTSYVQGVPDLICEAAKD